MLYLSACACCPSACLHLEALKLRLVIIIAEKTYILTILGSHINGIVPWWGFRSARIMTWRTKAEVLVAPFMDDKNTWTTSTVFHSFRYSFCAADRSNEQQIEMMPRWEGGSTTRWSRSIPQHYPMECFHHVIHDVTQAVTANSSITLIKSWFLKLLWIAIVVV